MDCTHMAEDRVKFWDLVNRAKETLDCIKEWGIS
jgi:hypothetical protein